MVDIHKPGDHRIVLGESLKDGQTSTSYIGIRYNWIPKPGFQDTSGSLKGTKDDLKLAYSSGNSQYDYAGWLSESSDQNPQLVLVYDRERSVYVLERLEASADLNINAGSDLSGDFIKRHTRLQRTQSGSEFKEHNAGNSSFDDNEDMAPDDTNPFDYRHFINEAKAAVEKQGQHGGGRTPLNGGRTPMSGLSSPLIGGSHPHTSTTPSFGPTEIVDATDKPQGFAGRRQKKPDTKPTKSRLAGRGPSLTSKAKTSTAARAPQVLSQEIVMDSDSDDESDDLAPPAPTLDKKPAKTQQRKASFSSESSTAPSPQLVLEDNDNDNDGLEVDTGSPPPEIKKHKYRVNRDVFVSGRNTPRPGHSTSRINDNRPTSRASNADADAHAHAHAHAHVDVEMPGINAATAAAALEDDDDENMKYLQDADSADEAPPRTHDNDVDDLILDDDEHPPSPPPPPLPSPKHKRRQSSTIKRRSKAKSASPPPALPHSHSTGGGDDDDLAAAELEAALEKAEQMMDAGDDGEEEGMGLGISGAQEDESDISEEE